MDRTANQCERRHFHCPSVGVPPPPSPAAVVVPIQPYATQSCAQANQSLDTVRSLHQTVVSLRNALDDARREISNLKKQMNVQTVIDEGRVFKEEQQESRAQKMGSHIDVKIRVSSNLNVSTGDVAEAAMSDAGAAPDSSRSGVVNIKLTSQENLNVSQKEENVYTFNQSTDEEVQVETNKDKREEQGPIIEEQGHGQEIDDMEEKDVDESEINNEDEDTDGDNSVFDDCSREERMEKETEADNGRRRRSQNVLQLPHQKLTRAHSDTQEEVDDIELIFSSDDQHRELHDAEEMVSISATFEPWQKPGASGTPVLLSFEKFSFEESEGQQQQQQRGTGRGETVTGQGRRKQSSLDESSEGRHKFRSSSVMNKASLDGHNDVLEKELPRSNLGQSKWRNPDHKKELHVTDISKCGISEENIMDMGRRNTCPNPPAYRPLFRDNIVSSSFGVPRHRNSLSANRCILGGRFTRPLAISSPVRSALRSPLIAITNASGSEGNKEDQRVDEEEEVARKSGGGGGPKRSSSVQTEISALPEYWQSESHLAGGYFANGLFTLPSKFNPVAGSSAGHSPRVPLRPSQKTQEARRVLLSDINFTSMIPELSRSADHLCPEEMDDNGEELEMDCGETGQENRRDGQMRSHHYHPQNGAHNAHHHHHHSHHHNAPQLQQHRVQLGHHLQTPNMGCYRKGLTQSTSVNSHGSMNECSLATQTTQTGEYWVQKGDSFDSTSNCYTMDGAHNDSRQSLTRSCRSRSAPSFKCVYCKRAHGGNGAFGAMKTSESMQYTMGRTMGAADTYASVKGSLPDLRHDCCCPRRYQGSSASQAALRPHTGGINTSVGSTESLVDDSDVFERRSTSNVAHHLDYSNRWGSAGGAMGVPGVGGGLAPMKQNTRRCSENDIGKSYSPSKQNLPFLPKSANCLKIGHLAKVIARNGRVVVGQVRYVGPICNAEYVARLDGGSHDTFIGLELPTNGGGDTDGTIDGKRFFYCEQNQGIFVPFPKVIMAWTS